MPGAIWLCGDQGAAKGMLGKARRMALSGWYALKTSIHAAPEAYRLKIACTRGFQGGSRLERGQARN